MNDYTEVKIAFSNPLVADFDGSETSHALIYGSSVTASSSGWIQDGDSIYATAPNGWLEYSLDIPADGVYVLKLTAEQRNEFVTGDSSFSIDIYVDGSYSGTQTLTAPENSTGLTLFFLPELNAGYHTVKLVWNNIELNTFLQINSWNYSLLEAGC